MVEYLAYENVVEINLRYGGPAAGVADEGGIRGVLGRPTSGFGDHEAFPTIWLKAASLLHGFATTQYFTDGNKRTAFLVATAFLDVNGYEIETPAPIQAEAFVLSTAAALLDVEQVAEWLQAAHQQRRPGPAFHAHLEYLMLARSAVFADGDGTISLLGGGWAGMLVDQAQFPILLPISVCARIHWGVEDLGVQHSMSIVVTADSGEAQEALNEMQWELPLDAPPIGGHRHHPGGILPTLAAVQLIVPMAAEAHYRFLVSVDGDLAGVLPFQLTAR